MSQSSSLISEHVKCLLESRIHLISEEWVNNVWDGDFTDLTCDWPDELADRENNVKYWGRLLANLLESCQEWPHEQPGNYILTKLESNCVGVALLYSCSADILFCCSFMPSYFK